MCGYKNRVFKVWARSPRHIQTRQGGQQEEKSMNPRTVFTRALFVCAFVVSLFFNPVWAHPEDAQSASPPVIEAPDPQTLIPGRVIRIFDGDTLLIQVGQAKHRYQLIASDTPEFLPKDRTPSPYSVESRRFIEQLLLGESVYIQHDPLGLRDQSKRKSAYIFRAPDMLFVNIELIRQGYAKHNPRHSTLYTDAFEFYESKAQDLKRGIWNPKADQPDWSDSTNQLTEDPDPIADPASSTQPDTATPQTQKSPQDNNDADTTSTLPASTSPTTVYITKSGKSYHTKDCQHLTDSKRSTTRDEVDSTHQPCKTCKPDG